MDIFEGAEQSNYYVYIMQLISPLEKNWLGGAWENVSACAKNVLKEQRLRPPPVQGVLQMPFTLTIRDYLYANFSIWCLSSVCTSNPPKQSVNVPILRFGFKTSIRWESLKNIYKLRNNKHLECYKPIFFGQSRPIKSSFITSLR